MRAATLTELMLVVIILAVLGAVAVSQQVRVMERGRATEAVIYLGTLRSAQVRHRANNPADQYTNDPAKLDVTLAASLPNWSAPTLSAPAQTGLATMVRTSGPHSGQTLGMQYGTGTLCGTFAPLQRSPCQAD